LLVVIGLHLCQCHCRFPDCSGCSKRCPGWHCSIASIRIDHSKGLTSQGFIFPMHVVGLVNLGNTCFMNAVLQSLVPFKDAFTQDNFEPDTLTHSLGSVLSQLENVPLPLPVVPARFRFEFIREYSYFADSHQHDAFEFLQLLMDGMHAEGPLATADDKPPFTFKESSSAEIPFTFLELSMEALKPMSDPISEFFIGQQLNAVKCHHCKTVSAKFTPHTVLSLRRFADWVANPLYRRGVPSISTLPVSPGGEPTLLLKLQCEERRVDEGYGHCLP